MAEKQFTTDLGETIRAVTPLVEAKGELLIKDFISAEEYRYHGQFSAAEGSIGIDDKGQPHVTGELFKGIDPKKAILALREAEAAVGREAAITPEDTTNV